MTHHLWNSTTELILIFMTYSTLPPTVRVINRVGFSVVYCVFQLYILNLKQSKIQNKLDGWGALLSSRNFVCFRKQFPWIKGKSLILRSYYTLQQYSTISMGYFQAFWVINFNWKFCMKVARFKGFLLIFWNGGSWDLRS